jgi:sugar (pentulose or hexulose) kinase
MNELFTRLFKVAMDGAPDCDGCLSYNYFAGEPLTDTDTGRPMFVRLPESKVTLANFMRAQLYGAIATMKIGVDFLREKEQVEVDSLLAQGGFFKTPGVGQQILADALHTPISVMSTAGEGGPWAMALLAAYMARKADGETMEDYLANKVFSKVESVTLQPDPAGEAGFEAYVARYKEGLAAQKAAAAISAR